MQLENKIALVTGASRGIGREIARTLAREGAYVIINYRGSKEKAEELAAEINADGETRAAIYGCDVADFEACEQMVRELIETYGHIDILVNNAGITRDGLVMKMGEDEFDSVLNTNLKGAFHTIRHLSRYMIKQRSGSIINITSVSGIHGNAGQANYSASKAGVIGLTKSVAKELASRGITCNAVAPGMIETDMTEVLSDKVKEAMQERIPVKRIGKPNDVAEVVAFLVSEKASYITGQVITVDGGMCM
jgi:3-oxoacyl-[acyl-carrier protein] reductase